MSSEGCLFSPGVHEIIFRPRAIQGEDTDMLISIHFPPTSWTRIVFLNEGAKSKIEGLFENEDSYTKPS